MAIIGNWMRDNEYMFREVSLSLFNEMKTLEKIIAKQKSLSTYKPLDVSLGQRVKDIKAELKKRGYYD